MFAMMQFNIRPGFDIDLHDLVPDVTQVLDQRYPISLGTNAQRSHSSSIVVCTITMET